MISKKTAFLVFFIFSISLLCAGKKILRYVMKCNEVTYTNVASGSRKTGRVYKFYVTVLSPKIKIDQVWFGDTPVPCEVYKMPGRIHVDSCIKTGNYLIEANRDLYKNFSSKFDSVTVLQNFNPKVSFKGEAILFYWMKGLRGSYVVNQVAVETKMKTRKLR